MFGVLWRKFALFRLFNGIPECSLFDSLNKIHTKNVSTVRRLSLNGQRLDTCSRSVWVFSSMSVTPWMTQSSPLCLKRKGDQWRWCETQITPLTETNQAASLIEIQSCVSSERVAELTMPFADALNTTDICVVFEALKKFHEEPQVELMDALAGQIIKQKATLTPRHVAHILHACGRVLYINKELFETLAQHSMLPFQLEAFTHREASNMLYAIGCLVRCGVRRHKEATGILEPTFDDIELGRALRNPAENERTTVLCPSQQEFVELLVRRFVTVTEFDTVTGWHVSNALHGAASIRDLSPLLRQKLADMAVHGPILRELNNYELCSIISSVGFLRHHDPEALELLLSEALSPTRLPLLSESGLSSILQGLALLQYDNRQDLLTLFTEMLRPWRMKNYTNRDLRGFWYNLSSLMIRDARFLDPLMKEVMEPDRLQSFSARDLFSILMSMLKLKYRNYDFLHAFVQEVASERRMNSTKDIDYPGYIWILGQLKYNNEEDVKKIMSSMLSTHKLEQMSERRLASILYGLAACDVRDQNSVQILLREIVKPERLQDFPVHSLASLIHSLGQMEQPLCPQTEAILKAGVCEEKLPKYSEYGLVAVVHAITHLKVTDNRMLQPLLREVRKPERIAAYQPGALSCLLFGLSGMRNRDVDLITRLAKEIVKAEKLSDFSPTAVTSLIISFGELRFQNLDIIERLLGVIVNSRELICMSNSTFAAFIYGMGQLHYNNSKEIVLPIIDDVTRRRSSFKNHELGAVINGLGNMGLDCGDYYTLQHIVAEALLSDRVSSYTIKELGRICSGLSVMNYTGPNMKPLLQRLFRPDIFENLDFKDLAGSAYALGRAGVKDNKMVQQLKNEVLRRGGRIEANQRYLTLLVQGVASMCDRKDYSFGQRLLELVFYQCGKNLDELANPNLTSILYGLGRIGVESKAMLFPLVQDSIKLRRLQKYTSHALASLIFGLGQFRFRDANALLPVVQEACREHRLRQFGNRELMGTIFSFCNMGMTQEQHLQPLLDAASHPTRLGKCTGSDLSMFFFSLVKIKPNNHSYLVNALGEATQSTRLLTLDDMSINAILFSITGLREHARSPSVLRPFVDQLCLPSRLEKMDGNVLGNVVYSLGRLSFLPVDFMDIVAMDLLKPHRLQRLSETALCNIINALGKSKYDNKGFMNALMEEATKSERMLRYHEGHILNIIYALGALRFSHPRFMAFMDRILSDVYEIDKLQPKTVLMIMHSYHLLRIGSHEAVVNVSKSIFSNPKRLAALNDVQLACLMDTLGNIQKYDRDKRDSVERTEHHLS